MYIFLNIQAVQKCKKCKPSHIFLPYYIQKGQRLETDQTNLTLLQGICHQRQFCFHVLTKLWSLILSNFPFWNDALLFIVLLSLLICLPSVKINKQRGISRLSLTFLKLNMECLLSRPVHWTSQEMPKQMANTFSLLWAGKEDQVNHLFGRIIGSLLT